MKKLLSMMLVGLVGCATVPRQASVEDEEEVTQVRRGSGSVIFRAFLGALAGFANSGRDDSPTPSYGAGLRAGGSDYARGWKEGYRGCAGAYVTVPTVPTRPSYGTAEDQFNMGFMDGYKRAEASRGCRR